MTNQHILINTIKDRGSEENKNLYWYGWRANVKNVLGWMSVILGIAALFGSVIAGLLFIGLGIYMIITSKAQKFDYTIRMGKRIED